MVGLSSYDQRIVDESLPVCVVRENLCRSLKFFNDLGLKDHLAENGFQIGGPKLMALCQIFY